MKIYCIYCGKATLLTDQTKSVPKSTVKCENCEENIYIKNADGQIQVLNEKVGNLKKKLDLELVTLSYRPFLVWALNKEDLSYSNLAHAYLEISRVLYKLLKDYSKVSSEEFKAKFQNIKLKYLQKGFDDLLKLIQNIQEKGTERGDPAKIQAGKESVWNNKNNLFSSLEFYETIMNNIKTNKLAILIGLSMIILAIFGLFFPL